MKYIKKPQSILIQGLEPFTFDNFVQHLINTDDKFNKSGPVIRLALRIEDALANGKTYVELENSQWEVLKEVAEAPSAPYPALYVTGSDGTIEKLHFGRRLLPFIDAIVEATDEKPVEVQESADGG